MDDTQISNLQAFRKVVVTFESGPGKDLDYHLDQYTEIMHDHGDPYEIGQAIIGDLKSLDRSEKEAVNEFLIQHGETELIPE